MNGRKSAGFTLLEILVVIVLIGVMSAATFAAMRRSQSAASADTFVELQAREMEALKAEINMLRRKGGHVYTPVVRRGAQGP